MLRTGARILAVEALASTEPAGTKSPIECRITRVSGFSFAKRTRPRPSIAWIAPAPALRTTRAGSFAGAKSAGRYVRALCCSSGGQRFLDRPPARLRDERGDGDRSEAVDEPVQEEQKEDQAQEHEAACRGDAEIGHARS